MAIPHDVYFLRTFLDPRLFAAWLQSRLPKHLSADLDWPSLRRTGERQADAELRSTGADLAYALDYHGGAAQLVVLPEHRSTNRPDLHDAMVRYAVQMLEREREAAAKSTFV
ncbi:MAG: Rpn family recombination-promoting nuclease/putative transposase, partial [Planctomycetes bacterium]|nr:Rpn family recombination-promoting nuclease/putative transposase [Planctomycetota bacterium]